MAETANNQTFFRLNDRVICMTSLFEQYGAPWPEKGMPLTIRKNNCAAHSTDPDPFFVGICFRELHIGINRKTGEEVSVNQELFAHIESWLWAEDVLEALTILWGSTRR